MRRDVRRWAHRPAFWGPEAKPASSRRGAGPPCGPSHAWVSRSVLLGGRRPQRGRRVAHTGRRSCRTRSGRLELGRSQLSTPSIYEIPTETSSSWHRPLNLATMRASPPLTDRRRLCSHGNSAWRESDTSLFHTKRRVGFATFSATALAPGARSSSLLVHDQNLKSNVLSFCPQPTSPPKPEHMDTDEPEIHAWVVEVGEARRALAA